MSNSAELSIIKETVDYIFLNKPSLLHSVRLPDGSGGASLADLLLVRDSKAFEYSEKPEDAGLVHRLDFETSGVIVAAKSREAWQKARKEFLDGKVYKSYLILTEGRFPEKIITENYLGSENRRSKKVKVYETEQGAKCRVQLGRTEFELVEYDDKKDISLVRAVAYRAHRHQVRVHAAHQEHPLVGDTLYGSTRPPPFLLHSESIQLLTEWGRAPLQLAEIIDTGN